MSKNYEAYFPKKKETSLIQASIDAGLAERVREFCHKEGITTKAFVTGLLMKWLYDQSPKKKGA